MRIGLSLCLLFLISCSSIQRGPIEVGDDISNLNAGVKEIPGELPEEGQEVVEEKQIAAGDLSPIIEESREKVSLEYSESVKNMQDYEVLGGSIADVDNKAVDKWVNYFTGRGRKHMDKYLARSSRYLPVMKSILKKNGLPEDLVYVALIESGFSSHARSRAAAVGYWQFIRETGKRYGLRIDGYVDERRDFVLATEASSKYFKALYSVFGDWFLAIAAYNVGENRIKRVVMNNYTRDFWEIASLKKLPKETLNYVPKFIAARRIAKDPAKYGFDSIAWKPALEFSELELKKAINLKQLAKNMNMDLLELKRLNPAFRSNYAPTNSNGKVVIKVPSPKLEAAKLAVAKSIVTSSRQLVRMQDSDTQKYRVRRGDTLGRIAQKFETRVSTLRRLNGLGRRSMIRAGKTLLVPRKASIDIPSPSVTTTADGRYRIRRGDNLSSIADKFGVRLSDLKRENGLGRRSIIRAGAYLKIPNNTSESSATYIVSHGDTLSSIASEHGVRISKLQAVNKLSRRSILRIGQKLTIPGQYKVAGQSKRYHTVRRGETLTHLAQRYGTSLSRLATENKLSSRSRIKIGQRLVIPE